MHGLVYKTKCGIEVWRGNFVLCYIFFTSRSKSLSFGPNWPEPIVGKKIKSLNIWEKNKCANEPVILLYTTLLDVFQYNFVYVYNRLKITTHDRRGNWRIWWPFPERIPAPKNWRIQAHSNPWHLNHSIPLIWQQGTDTRSKFAAIRAVTD